MTFYDNAQNTALELIERFGQPVTINRHVPGTFDPVTGQESAGSTSANSALGVATNFSAQNTDGELIKKGDKLVTVAAKGLAITPTLSDVVVIGGSSHTVVHVEEINPAGTPIVYKLQVRA